MELEGKGHPDIWVLVSLIRPSSMQNPLNSSSTGTEGIEQHSMLAVGPPNRSNPSKTSAAPSTETTSALTLRATGCTKGYRRSWWLRASATLSTTVGHIPRFAQSVGFNSHVDTRIQEPFLVIGMVVFKTMEEPRSNNSLGTSFRSVRRGQPNGDGDALRINMRAVLWARTSGCGAFRSQHCNGRGRILTAILFSWE